MIRLLVAALILVSLLGISDAAAQRGSSSGGRPTTGGRATAIRAELAQVLLQSRQYDDAAREYRALLQQNPSNRSYRLNLARALAWGERFPEAEAELRILAAQQPGNSTVDALLLTVRKALRPPADVASRWFAERPGSPEYRRILARALARERPPRFAEALAHYDTLLAQRGKADLYLERAYVHLQRRSHAEAEADLITSINTSPTADALVALGDLRRWRGDLGSAHALLSRARSISPASREVAAAVARLARDERPAAAFIPQASDPPGWQTTSTTATDNLGALLTTMAVRRGFATPRGLEGSVGVKALRLSDRLVNAADDVPLGTGGPGAVPDAANGLGADFALSGESAYRELYARARVRAGFVHHPSADLIPDAAFTLTAWVRAWGAGVETSTGPAYPSLVTMASFIPLPGTGTQLRERTTAVSVAGPLGRLDVAMRAQSSAFSDDNTRNSIEGFARVPVVSQFSLLYTGSSLAFERPSLLYWDPARYTVHSAGVEYALRRWRGLSFAARVLPGRAWSRERPVADTIGEVRSATAQLSFGAEAGYRGDSWEIGTTLGYGRGRTGRYERIDALVQVRYIP